MAKTGPQRYPGASTKYWYQSRYPGSAMESNVVVLHTTEGTSVPTYGGGGSAPNFTAHVDFKNKKLVWYQHFDFDVSSRALVNASGGVETNTANAVQVELVGTCDPSHRTSWNGAKAGSNYLYWPDAPDWALIEVARFLVWAHKNHGVRLAAKRPDGRDLVFKAYPSSYGSNGVRLSGSEWGRFYGVCGHQHVPENHHGDPGDLDVKKIIDYALKINNNEEVGAVALSTSDVSKILKTDGLIKSPDHKDAKETNKFWTAESYFYETYRRAREAKEASEENTRLVKSLVTKADAQATAIAELAKAVATLSTNNSVDPDALVARITEAIENVSVRLDVDNNA
jgi:hypothetical protein